ncbi:MAG TPA: hypothetical protein VIK91_02510 [Nannocystis sp.]
MRIVSLALVTAALALACASRSSSAPAPADPVPTDSAAAITDPTPTEEHLALVDAHCTSQAECPGGAPVRCSGSGAGRCVAMDKVGCGFIPEGGALQVRCCDGSTTCDPDAFGAR